MRAESDFFGIYFESQLVTSLLALCLTYGLHRLLTLLGVYRHVWHPALFEVAFFLIVWYLVLVFLPYFLPH